MGGGALSVSDPKTNILHIKDLCKSFSAPNGETREVLSSFNLDVRKQEFLSIIGPSGCGKTTLLRILCGLESSTEGSVQWRDNPKVAMVFQNALLLPWRTVLENTTFSLECQGEYGPMVTERAVAILEAIGLADHMDYHPHEISSGMSQRVGLARALLVEPDVLLMDEPYSALDIDTRRSLQNQLLELWENNQFTVIFVSHSLDEVAYLSDRVAFVNGSPAKVQSVVDVELKRPRGQSRDDRVALVDETEKLASLFGGSPSPTRAPQRH